MSFNRQTFSRSTLVFLVLTGLAAFGDCLLVSRIWAEGSQSVTGSDIGESGSTGQIEGKVISPWIRRMPGIVYIEKIEGHTYPPSDAHSVMDQKDLVFVPHILPVLVGTTVEFPNSDAVRHSVFSTRTSAKVFNLGTYPPGVAKEIVFDKAGVTTLLCNVHTEMVAYIVVLETPYYAFTDTKGGFTIKGIPAGAHRITFWHEKMKPATQEVVVGAGETAQVTFANLSEK